MEVVILQATGTSVISPKLDVPVDEMADDDRAQMLNADNHDVAADVATDAASLDATGDEEVVQPMRSPLHHRTCPYCRQKTSWTGPETAVFDQRTRGQATSDDLFGELWRSHVEWSERLAEARAREREMEMADRQARRWYLRELSWHHERAEMSAQLHVLEDAILGQSEAQQAQLRELRQYQDRFDELADMRGAAHQQARAAPPRSPDQSQPATQPTSPQFFTLGRILHRPTD